MGSVISQVECPICCNKEAFYECYYKINREFIFCDVCGYTSDSEVDNGKGNGGYGAMDIEFKNGMKKISGIRKLPFKTIKSNVKKLLKDKGIKKVSYTLKIRGEWYSIDGKTDKRINIERMRVEDEI